MSVKYHFLRGLFAMGSRGAIAGPAAGLAARAPALRWRHRLPLRAYAQRIDELDKQYAGIDKPL